MTKNYSSKVSFGLLIFIFLVCYGPLIPILIKNELNGYIICTIGFLSIIFAFFLNFFFKTRYTIDKKELKIKCGIFTYKPIDIENVKEISNTKSVISSPAPSFDRIKVKYGKSDEIIISPKDKLNFAKELTKINPNIVNMISE